MTLTLPDLPLPDREEQFSHLAKDHRYCVLELSLKTPISFGGGVSLVDLAMTDFLETRESGRACRLDFLVGSRSHDMKQCVRHLEVLWWAEKEFRDLYDLTEKDRYSISFPLPKTTGKRAENARLHLHVLAEGSAPQQRYALEIRSDASQKKDTAISEPDLQDRFYL